MEYHKINRKLEKDILKEVREEKNSVGIVRKRAVSLLRNTPTLFRKKCSILNETPRCKLKDFTMSTKGKVELVKYMDYVESKHDWESETIRMFK